MTDVDPTLMKIATGAAGGATGIWGLVSLWRFIGKELLAAREGKRAEEYAARTASRITDLERELKECQQKSITQAEVVGELRGEAKALRMQNSDLETYKTYWHERALNLERLNQEQDRVIDCLSMHVVKLELRIPMIAADDRSAIPDPLDDLPQGMRDRVEKARTDVLTAPPPSQISKL